MKRLIDMDGVYEMQIFFEAQEKIQQLRQRRADDQKELENYMIILKDVQQRIIEGYLQDGETGVKIVWDDQKKVNILILINWDKDNQKEIPTTREIDPKEFPQISPFITILPSEIAVEQIIASNILGLKKFVWCDTAILCSI